jgi:serine/threonine protein kinase
MSFVREANAVPIPGYRLIEPLGSGGFGEVWKCEAPGGLFKAIKFVYGNLNSLDGDAARAEQEFKALNRVKEVRHPFVLSMDRIEVVEGELVIVMELADQSLHDRFVECQAAGQLGIPRDDLLRYLRDAAEALDHMFERHQLQHLDIKPRNLFLISDRVKVADFGLVRHLELQGSSSLMGGATPLYAAPETFNGNLSPHSDQYSLAIVYQELLTGQRPFDAKNIRQLAFQHLKKEPDLRALPESERAVMARALAKDPAQRFPNCLAFVRALYTARAPVRVGASAATISKAKTLHETMEDVLLENVPEEEAGPEAPANTAEEAEVSSLGLTVAQPNTGALRPTLLIGVGAFGRQALLELRCRFLDRFGDLEKVPVLRFLYVDTDPEAINRGARGSPEVAFSRGESYHLPLQPVAHYRRRTLDQLSDWMPREKLYALPRSLQTQGSRALGRLAFADNYLRFLARLKRELEQASHPDAIYQSVTETGLALRSNSPRVYVVAAAGGGGSGFLVDLGYALRRLLQQLRHPDADVHTMLLCGAPSDPATPSAEQANIYATLTELHHFTDTSIPFTAQYGPDGPRLVDEGQPFSAIYLLPLAHRSPEALRDAVAHLGSYLFHEVSTPLGVPLQRLRLAAVGSGASRFRSFGTHGVWFPRGLMLRLAAQQACLRLIDFWQAVGPPTATAEVQAACARAVADPEFQFEAVCARLAADAAVPGEGHLKVALSSLLSRLGEEAQQPAALSDAGNWAVQAVTRVSDWIGDGYLPAHESEWQRTRMNRALSAGVQALVTEWDRRLSKIAFRLMDHSGRRLAAAESALMGLVQFCKEASTSQAAQLPQQHERTQQARNQLEAALEDCVSKAGGFSFFGGKSRRLLRVFIDQLGVFSHQCLSEAVLVMGVQFFTNLQGRLDERIRELSFCRQRLRPLQESLQAAGDPGGDMSATAVDTGITPSHTPLPSTGTFWEAIRHTRTARVVLPKGETNLERAATHFLGTLTPEQWAQLDQAIQDRVLTPLGGLHHVCATGGDLNRSLAPSLIDQTARCLGDFLPITDVAQVELAAAAEEMELTVKIQKYNSKAAPLVTSPEGKNQEGFLLIPASEAGKTFGERARQAVPRLHLVLVPGQAGLLFCREQGAMTLEDLQRVLGPCRSAYEESAPVPQSSPHARFDIRDWVPLDP